MSKKVKNWSQYQQLIPLSITGSSSKYLQQQLTSLSKNNNRPVICYCSNGLILAVFLIPIRLVLFKNKRCKRIILKIQVLITFNKNNQGKFTDQHVDSVNYWYIYYKFHWYLKKYSFRKKTYEGCSENIFTTVMEQVLYCSTSMQHAYYSRERRLQREPTAIYLRVENYTFSTTVEITVLLSLLLLILN